MKKTILLLSLVIILASCGVKSTQNLLSSGNYDVAIDKAISNLRTNKDKKGKQDYIYLLEEAFAKAKERDLNAINLLAKDANPVQLEKMYNIYLLLNQRQEKIKPLLPLPLIRERRNAIFPFDNYNDQIIDSKNALSSYLYANSKKLLLTANKMNFRKAYDDLQYLNQINPNYKDVLTLMDNALYKGSDYVMVETVNQSNLIIPARLQNSLLDFDTYGLNDKWTVYHTYKQKGINYDYGMRILFNQIYLSPEQINQKEFVKVRKVKDGTTKLLDDNGKEVLDKDGKVIMVDVFKNLTVLIYESRQFKSCQINAVVDYVDYQNNRLLKSFPLTAQSVFENIYSKYKGDRLAADDNYYGYFDNGRILFPSNEQIIYDTAEDLKSKIKNTISRNPFRK
ncbi:hypothetical protein FQU23_006005 [Flavobacterium sp. XN-5]|uniref:hypothetical protein n=1 Tax=Flavobacterium sp. XN-5 TaxID=2599390 RepID=UPI0011C90E97|nr:hypothetical protein [Flavobacterium sp. XN-5]NGY37065.1 hypothetical protein [Flavobacterium sp. XN-5]